MSERVSVRPRASVLGLVFMASLPLDGVQVLGGRSTPFYASLAFVAAELLSQVAGRKGPSIPPAALLPAYCYLSFALLSTFWADNGSASLATGISLASAAVPVLLLAPHIGDRPAAYLRAYLVGAALLAVTVLAAPPDLYTGRRTALGNANDVAFFLVLAVAFAAFRLRRSEGAARLVLWLLLPLYVVATVSTGSRSAVLAIVITAAVAVLVVPFHEARQRTRLRDVVQPLVLTGAVAGGVLLLPDALKPDRLAGTFAAIDAGDFTHREDYWRPITAELPSLVGSGYGMAPEALAEQLNTPSVAHSVWFGTWLELGLVGLLVLGWLLVAAFRSGWRLPSWQPLVLLMMPGALIASSTLTIEWRRMFWLYIAVLIAAEVRTSVGPGTRARRLAAAQRA